jgi:septal ring factor EnvC (AmiA/AmiB activator)
VKIEAYYENRGDRAAANAEYDNLTDLINDQNHLKQQLVGKQIELDSARVQVPIDQTYINDLENQINELKSDIAEVSIQMQIRSDEMERHKDQEKNSKEKYQDAHTDKSQYDAKNGISYGDEDYMNPTSGQRAIPSKPFH